MATISGLNTFTAGTPAQASQVNTNFGIVKSFAEGLSTGTNIDSGSISNEKLSPNAVTSDKILNGTIVADDLASNAVTTVKITDASVTSPKLAAPTLVNKTASGSLLITDANCTLYCNAGITLTVPTSSVPFANGTVITVINYGGGVVSISNALVPVRSSNGLKLRTTYSAATLIKLSDGEWLLTGDTIP
jgi:hypothetical protein